MQTRALRLGAGLLAGFISASVLVLSLSRSIMAAQAANTVLSAMTYSGFALVIFGYFYKRKGQKNFTADFLLGLGLGLILIYYVEAGMDIIPTI